MREEQQHFLRLAGRLPARLTVEQVAFLLNCAVHDVPVLVAAKLLRPLGEPAQNAPKFFATKTVLERMQDEKWLHRLTIAITGRWQAKNARRGRDSAEATSAAELVQE